jgi:CubicO group peptidase (beta-lactamase class C family)
MTMPHAIVRARWASATLGLLLSACGGGNGPPPDENPGLPAMITLTPENTGDGWQVSTPAAEQIDEALVLRAMEEIRDNTPKVDSLLVIRHGRLVAEGYFNGFGRESLHDLRSTGKSFISALAGIAESQALLGTHDRVSRFVSDFESHAHMDDRKRSLEVFHLLNMLTGLECDDSNDASPGWEERVYRSRDWVKFVLDLRMVAAPGARFSYCTGGVVVLGHVIAQASGMSLDGYADAWLFGPLGIRESRWPRSPDGRAAGGTGLRLRPRDAAKLGALYANEGLWNGVRVIPEEFVMRSRQRVHSSGTEGYGYLWWKRQFTHRGAPIDCFYTAGNGGNHIFVFPTLELVVAYTGSNYNAPQSGLPHQMVPSILAAVP